MGLITMELIECIDKDLARVLRNCWNDQHPFIKMPNMVLPFCTIDKEDVEILIHNHINGNFVVVTNKIDWDAKPFLDNTTFINNMTILHVSIPTYLKLDRVLLRCEMQLDADQILATNSRTLGMLRGYKEAIKVALNSLYGMSAPASAAFAGGGGHYVSGDYHGGYTHPDPVLNYAKADVENTLAMFEWRRPRLPEIDNVIFNGPATIVFWSDGTKTIVKAQPGEVVDKEKGLMAAIVKKGLGNQGNYYKKIKKWLKED